jgi:hypothetical protein
MYNTSGIFTYSAGPVKTYEWPNETFAKKHAEFLQPDTTQFSGYWDADGTFHVVKDRREEINTKFPIK